MHQASRRAVVGADDAVWALAHQARDRLLVVRIEPPREGAVHERTACVECLAIPRFAGVNGGGGVGNRDEGQALAAEAQEVIGGDGAGGAIVDADDIVSSGVGIGVEGAIEQDKRDARLVEGAGDALVDGIALRRVFERGKEDPRDTALQIVEGELPCALGLGRRITGTAPPHQGMLACERGVHHSLAHRLEDVGLTQIGNEETEGEGTACRRPANICAGARAPFDEPLDLQVAQGATDGDAGVTESPDEFGLAWQAIAHPPAPRLDLSSQCGEDVRVFQSGRRELAHMVASV